ncbi:MAG: RCC1 repeat- and reductase domain-containing protein [Acidimicrobiales bacterium]
MRFAVLREFVLAGVLVGSGIAIGCAPPASPARAPAGGADPIMSVAAGAYAGYAVLADGHVWAWGDDLEGQIGDTGPWSSRTVPAEVQGLSGVISVAGSGNSAFALRRDGEVWAWGDDSEDQLADGRFTDRQLPGVVPKLTAVREIAAGAFTVYAIRDDGTVWAWGDNSFGQLGSGSSGQMPTVPQKVVRLTDVVAIRSGTSDAYALRADGTVWVWGDDSLDQLGGAACGSAPAGHHGVCAGSAVPNQVPGLSGMVAIAAGGDSGYALRRDGSVWAWGDDEFGELGNGVRRFDVGSPVRVRGLHDVVAITAGACSAYALLRNGTVWAWGRGDFGQLGNGSISEERVPVRVKGLTGVVQVVGGGSTVLALERDRSPWSWGANAFGQLGNNSVVNRDLPVRVLGLPGSPRPGKTQPDARPAG